MRRLIWAGLLPTMALMLVSCGGASSSTSTPPVSGSAYYQSSSSMLLSADGESLYLTAPDERELVAMATADLTILQRVKLPRPVFGVAQTPQSLVVGLSQGLAVVNKADWSYQVLELPCGDVGSVVAWQETENASYVLAGCPHDQRLVLVDLQQPQLIRVIAAPQRPAAIALAGHNVAVTSSHTAQIVSIPRSDLLSAPLWGHEAPAPQVLAWRSLPIAIDDGASVTQLDHLAVDPSSGALVATYQQVDAVGNRDRPPELGGYGAVIDNAPRIEPRIWASCGGRYARFDGGARVFSGPSALAYHAGTGLLWVANRYTDNVAVLSCALSPLPDSGTGWSASQLNQTLPLLRQFRFEGNALHGIRALVLSADGRTAYIDNAFQHSVSRLRLDDGAPLVVSITDTRLRPPSGAYGLSDEAMRGRDLFFNAKNTHLTPSGVVTCGSCHPDGGDDGIRWFIHTLQIERKLRRTTPAWGARAALLPLHWDGEYTQAGTLITDTIESLLEGDGLLIDVAAINQYLEEIAVPAPLPVQSWEIAQHAEGEVLFVQRCASCHIPPAFSDGLNHEVISAGDDADGELQMVNTPSLLNVRSRAPYLHDGRAATLGDVLSTYNVGDLHGVTSDLTTSQRQALLQYMKAL